jgi:hypothetical protein
MIVSGSFWLRRCSTLVLLIGLTLPCAGCARDDCSFRPSSASAATVIPDGLGVNIEFTDPRPGEMKMLSQAGFRWVRMDLKWDVTEPEPGRYDFAAYDRLMSSLAENDLKALFILDYTNPAYDNGAPPHSETARRAFAQWAVAAAKHFAGRGVVWEMYNEPNIAHFWPPRPNVKDYIALALAVGRAFRESVPGEKLIGPATSGIDFDFLAACFKAGLLEYWSAVSVHPYRRSDPETAAADYCRLRAMIKTYAPAKQVAIFSGEWGYSSVWPGLSDDQQGQLLARSWLTNLGNAVPVSIWYDWRDDGLSAVEPEHHFGTVYNAYHEERDPVFDPKPAYLAAKTLTTFLSGYHFEKRLATGGADDYLLAFRKGSSLRLAAWTTSTHAHQISIPVSPGQYAVSSHTGQNITVVTAAQESLVVAITNAPVYLRSGNEN